MINYIVVAGKLSGDQKNTLYPRTDPVLTLLAKINRHDLNFHFNHTSPFCLFSAGGSAVFSNKHTIAKNWNTPPNDC